MACASVTKTVEMFSQVRFERNDRLRERGKNHYRNKTPVENPYFEIGIVKLLRELLERIKVQLQISSRLNGNLDNPVSTKTVRWELHKARFQRKAAIRKLS